MPDYRYLDSIQQLYDLADQHYAAGRHKEAEPLLRQAQAIVREAVGEQHPDYAKGLDRLAPVLSELGRHEEALEVVQQAVGVRRAFAEAEPEVYLEDLAATLNNLANRCGQCQRHDEALEAACEVAEIRRHLTEAGSETSLASLAASLSNLGIRYGELDRLDEALEAVSESVEILRRLAETQPEAFLGELAGSLNNLGIVHARRGQQQQALSFFCEAIATFTPPFERSPAECEADMMTYFGNYIRMADELDEEQDFELIGPIVARLRKLEEDRIDKPQDGEEQSA